MKLTKMFKTVICAAAAALVLILASLSGAVAKKNKELRQYKATVAEKEATIKEQKETIIRLAAMEAVHCEVSITVRNTAVMGANRNGEISQDAKQVATYLRGEILEALQEAEGGK